MTTLKTLVTAATVAVTALGSLAGTVQAGDWRGNGYGGGYYGPRHYAPAPPHYGYGHYQEPRRDRRGEKIAAGVAIGVGALILGSILANQSRARHYRGY